MLFEENPASLGEIITKIAVSCGIPGNAFTKLFPPSASQKDWRLAENY